jgi:hypothetical protein
MYWWLIFWIWVFVVITTLLLFLQRLFARDGKNNGQELFVLALSSWISVSSLIFFWQHLAGGR